MQRIPFTPAISALALVATVSAQNAFPLPASAAPGSTNASEGTAPFLVPTRMTQTRVTDRNTLVQAGLPQSMFNWDMSTFDTSGRYIFTPAEVGSRGGGVRAARLAAGSRMLLHATTLPTAGSSRPPGRVDEPIGVLSQRLLVQQRQLRELTSPRGTELLGAVGRAVERHVIDGAGCVGGDGPGGESLPAVGVPTVPNPESLDMTAEPGTEAGPCPSGAERSDGPVLGDQGEPCVEVIGTTHCWDPPVVDRAIHHATTRHSPPQLGGAVRVTHRLCDAEARA